MDPEKVIEKIKSYLTVLDLPSGVIMGIYSLSVIGLSVASFIKQHPIDTSVITAYSAAIAGFTVNKTAKVLKSGEAQ